MIKNVFEPHSDKQSEVIFSDEHMTLCACGTQWGKSIAGTLWMKRQMHTFTDQSDNFIIAAPTYKILSQSIIPYFTHYMHGFGDYSKTDGVFRMKRAGTCYFRTETDPDSIVGIPNVKAGWLDEAGKLRLYFFENYQARAAPKGAKSLLTTSPYSLNWMYHQFIKPIAIQGKTLPGVKLIQAASWENPYHMLHDPVKREAHRAQMDSRRFNMLFGGEWGQMIGMVYDCWDDAENYINPIQLPTDTRYYAGVDWGYYPDPFAMVVRAVTPNGMHYGVSEFMQTRLTISDIITLCRQKKQVFGIEAFYCDPSQPGYIEEFNRAGLTAIPADNDIRRGIDLHYELIKTRRYKEFTGLMPHTADERETYHYPEAKDLGPDDNSKELVPVDQANHLVDASRYATIMTYRSGIRHTPKVAGGEKKAETLEQKIARLKRMRSSGRNSKQTEDWS